MTGFIQVAPDSTGKQLDNDVVTVPAGTTITDGSGNQTVLASPLYLFRERIVVADPSDPLGVATVTNAVGPGVNDRGLTVRLPFGQPDLSTIAALLQDIDANIQQLALASSQAPPTLGMPVVGMPQSILTPTIPRPLILDQFGRQIMVAQGTRESIFSNNITITSVVSAQTLIAQAAADTYNDIIAILAANTSATGTELDISDGTRTIPLYVPATDMRGFTLGGVIIPASTTGVTWTATTITSVASVKVWVMYVANKSR
jgi:hypothetical protein